ncbi:uroporphyrin-III C-methyltransferase/precorrin-2 dehydrogenase/sirohydrochlorin ferrochelatase [Oceanisphaera litoralis]|uniref:siroheme synthase CysG n=1 Tax=Oceanisphaera litoralis TaxID=225144 RepID=UPI00195A80F8|nr:siroheme synthase CysG [Oceanisphaera litoralis]MBM7456501.1 uroporphyrin-III C-methyltransferase/precorrin-2 dehydrogenase/sirohydrochlorin ferrochelatase [Oceanisphaera litoralis]
MEHLPLFIKIKQRPCLVVGGGAVAARKVRVLLARGARVTVVAPALSPELQQLQGQFVWQNAVFSESDLDDQFLVVAATDSSEVNARVYQLANRRGLLVNKADDSKRSAVIFPSIIERLPIQVAFSTGGDAPWLARLLRARLDALLPKHWGQLSQVAGKVRQKVKRTLSSSDARRRFWARTQDDSTLNAFLKQGNLAAAELWLQQEIEQEMQAPQTGEVILVGAGPGDPDLLTVKALNELQKAEVVLFDQLVSEEILALIRPEAELISVGKKAGHHSVPQDQINRLLVEQAQAGKRVVRLKGGDPFMFGRGAEELQTLKAAGIRYQVVPGITAAAGATAYAGIPLTHRDHAQSAVFITGHCKKDGKEPDWASLARSRQTLVIYMGLMRSAHIQQRLIEQGLDAATPVALIERGTTAQQRVVRGELRELGALAEQVVSPSLMVIGEVAALADSLAWFNPRPDTELGQEQYA